MKCEEVLWGPMNSWKPRLKLRCFPGREGSGQKRPFEVMRRADAKAGREETAQDVYTTASSAGSEQRVHEERRQVCLWREAEARSGRDLSVT